MTLTPPADAPTTPALEADVAPTDSVVSEGAGAEVEARADHASLVVEEGRTVADDGAPDDGAPVAEGSQAASPVTSDDVVTADATRTGAVTGPDEPPAPAASQDVEAPSTPEAHTAALDATAAAVAVADVAAPTTAAAGSLPDAPTLESEIATASRGESDRPRRVSAGPRPAAPRGFPRAERPGNVPVPQHHHLPGWVRRDYARVRPALADLLGLLQGQERAQFQRRVEELNEGISSGKFSLAFQYPELVEEGRKLYEGQREHIVEVQQEQRILEGVRRKAADKIREAADVLGPDAAARLHRSLRSAVDAAAIAEIEAEAQRALGTARTTQTKRRDREIERTRSQIRRTLPKTAVVEEPQSETWQDVLRRFAQDQAQDLEVEQKAGAGSES